MKRIWRFFLKDRQRGGIGTGVIVGIACIFMAITLTVAVPIMMDTTTRMNLSEALSVLVENGYVAYAAPSGDWTTLGDLYTKDIYPQTDSTYDIGVAGGEFRVGRFDSLVSSNVTAPTGRTASYVIAAFDATATEKAQADYVMPTAASDTGAATQTAINSLNATATWTHPGGGNIQYTSGYFAFTTQVVFPADDEPMKWNIGGAGEDATILVATSAITSFFAPTNTARVYFHDFSANGATTLANYFWTGKTYLSKFENLHITTNVVAGLNFPSNTDAGTVINDCFFTTNPIDVSLSAASGFEITHNTFGGGSTIHINSTGSSSHIIIDENTYGDGAANCVGIKFNGGSFVSISNNHFELPNGTTIGIQLLTDDTSATNIVDFQILGNIFVTFGTSGQEKHILLDAGTKTFTTVQIMNNLFDTSAKNLDECISVYGGGGKYISNLNISNNTIRVGSRTVTYGFAYINGGVRLTKDCIIKNNYSDLATQALINCNPWGLIATPFATAWNVIGLMGYTATLSASTDYYVGGCDLFITAANSANADNAISITDKAGNVIESGLSTLTNKYIPAGYKINWGAFTGAAGAVSVWGN